MVPAPSTPKRICVRPPGLGANPTPARALRGRPCWAPMCYAPGSLRGYVYLHPMIRNIYSSPPSASVIPHVYRTFAQKVFGFGDPSQGALGGPSTTSTDPTEIDIASFSRPIQSNDNILIACGHYHSLLATQVRHDQGVSHGAETRWTPVPRSAVSSLPFPPPPPPLSTRPLPPLSTIRTMSTPGVVTRMASARPRLLQPPHPPYQPSSPPPPPPPLSAPSLRPASPRGS